MNPRLGRPQHLIALVGLVVGLFVLLSVLAPTTYPTGRNIASMASQMAPIGLLALCICLAFLIGGIDLSVVAVANASAIASALTINALEPRSGAFVAAVLGVTTGLVLGMAAGLINGILVSRLRVHPIPITLGTSALFVGVSTGVTGGSTQFGTGSLNFLGSGTLLGVPTAFILFVAVVVALSLVTVRTPFGFRMYSVGASEKVSRFSRMNVERIQVLTYVVIGLIAAAAGQLMFASTNAANASFGSSYLIQAILVAVLTGVNPYGGRGRVALVVLAVAAMQQVQTGINMAMGRTEGATFAAEFSWGVLLIAVLGLSQRLGSDGERAWRFWQRKDAEAATAAGELDDVDRKVRR